LRQAVRARSLPTVSSGRALFKRSSARVLATTSFKASQQILCSAFLTEPSNDPPLTMTSLNVIRKNTQTGQ